MSKILEKLEKHKNLKIHLKSEDLKINKTILIVFSLFVFMEF